jgi:hypothetical protein
METNRSFESGWYIGPGGVLHGNGNLGFGIGFGF